MSQPSAELTSAGQDAAEAAIRQLEALWGQALVSGDLELLDRLLDEDFTRTDPSGGFVGKAQHLADIRDGRFVATAHDSEDLLVRLYGAVAVVTALVTTRARNASRDLSGRFRTLRVYVKRPAGWRLVAHQATRIQAGT